MVPVVAWACTCAAPSGAPWQGPAITAGATAKAQLVWDSFGVVCGGPKSWNLGGWLGDLRTFVFFGSFGRIRESSCDIEFIEKKQKTFLSWRFETFGNLELEVTK